MIFFVGNDGTVLNSVPSTVYQGSANANDIYLVAPFAENLTVGLAFKLPNGVYTSRYIMTGNNELREVINKQTGKNYSVWSFSLPNAITEYYGTVTVQFYFYAATTGKVLASSSTSFVVGRGVPEVEPEEPDENIYNQILSTLSELQSDLTNGYYSARALYAYNSEYTYGANEQVYYPDYGTYGVLLKSIADNNDNPPYTNGTLNSGYWEVIVDYNILNELYGLKSDAEQYAGAAQASATEAANTVAAGKTEIAALVENGEDEINSAVLTGKAELQTIAAQAANSAMQAAQSATDASASLEAAQAAAVTATNAAELAESFAQYGIKTNSDYTSVSQLPVPGNAQYIYFIPNGSSGDNSYDEWVWIDSKSAYEKIGTTTIDLSDYVTQTEQTEALAGKANTSGSYPNLSVGQATNATNAATANKVSNALTIKRNGETLDAYDGSAAKEVNIEVPVTSVNGETGDVKLPFYYGACPTAAATTAKVVTLSNVTDFALETGVKITVGFANSNTVSSPTLNVNGTGAIAVKCYTRTTALVWLAGIIEFIYDGTYWQIVGGYSLADKPVGYLYISTDSTSPATLFGGTWTAITSGYYLKAITSGTSSYGAAGLPNIEGTFQRGASTENTITTAYSVTTGAFYAAGTNQTKVAIGNSSTTFDGYSALGFDASLQNSIYGNSTTVTPLNYGVYMWRRVS